MRGHLARALILALVAGPLGAGVARGLTLDWDTNPWPGTGVRTASYTVGSGTVTITVTDPDNVIDGSGSGFTPGSLATNTTLNPPSNAGEDNLFIKTDENTNSNTGGDYVWVDITFSHAGGVADLEFSIYDIDQQPLVTFFGIPISGFTDQIYVEFANGATTYSPTGVTALTGTPTWSFDGSRTITGSGNNSNTSENGTAAIAYNGTQWLNRVSFQYRNVLDQGQLQFIGLSSINFRQAPEPSTGLLLGLGLAVLAGTHRRRPPRT
jgi:hypothetical protein